MTVAAAASARPAALWSGESDQIPKNERHKLSRAANVFIITTHTLLSWQPYSTMDNETLCPKSTTHTCSSVGT